MNIYFCRDSDGTPTTWRYKQKKPALDCCGCWCTGCCESIITEGIRDTNKKFGRGFHGVRKGKMKFLDLKSLKHGI